MTTTGQSDSRTLKGGQVLGLSRSPGEKWRITSFEHSHRVRAADGGAPLTGNLAVNALLGQEQMLEWQTTMPPSWKDMRFDSADEAVAFVEAEIAALPSNRA